MQQERLSSNTMLPKKKGNLSASNWSKPAN